MAPEKNFWHRQFQIMKHFFKFGQVLMDRAYHQAAPKSEFRGNSFGIENIFSADKSGKGIILLSAHAGGWHLASSLIDRHNMSHKMEVIHFEAHHSVFEIHEALGKGKAIGIMADRPLGNRYELVTFLGKLAPFDVTAFRLAATCRALLLYSFGFKAAGKNYDFYASSPRTYEYDPQKNQDVQCREWAQEFARDLETKLRKYPNQWFNFYSFWSSLPASPQSSNTSPTKNHLEEELHKPNGQKAGLESASKANDAAKYPR
jgi:predicted LPLAT superfamily acyltransferase